MLVEDCESHDIDVRETDVRADVQTEGRHHRQRQASWSSFERIDQSTSPSPTLSLSLSASPSPSINGSIDKQDHEHENEHEGSPATVALRNLNIQTPSKDEWRESTARTVTAPTTPRKRAASERDDDQFDREAGLPSKRYSHSRSHSHTVERDGVFFLARPSAGLLDGSVVGASSAIDDGQDDDVLSSADLTPRRISAALYLQPETLQITEEQLIVEVQGIYSGIVTVEKKCVEIDMQQLNSRTELSNDQWEALIAIHRTLLHEHHDFFLASQHPSATERLRKLASEYGMPARMWRHGVHSFLELLRHRLPGSLEHMISFIYTAYSMMTLLLESVPAFVNIWIECLGDLARYRMAVEEVDLHDRENWAEVARYWYRMAADKSPNTGRIQHHSAVLARPNILAQLFYYSKSLVCVEPFANSRESILLLFNPLLEEEQQQQKAIQQKQHKKQQRPKQQRPYPVVLSSFVKAHGIMFKKQSVLSFLQHSLDFLTSLPQHIGRTGERFREQGVHISCTNIASLFINDAAGKLKASFSRIPVESRMSAARIYWSSCSRSINPLVSLLNTVPASFETKFDDTSLNARDYTAYMSMHTLSLLLRQIGDKNVLPAVHVSLAFLFTLSLTPEAMHMFEPLIPFRELVTFLNTLNRQRVSESRLASDDFPLPECWDVTGTYHLPEDFDLRGLDWTRPYFPDNHFVADELAGDEERMLEVPIAALVRAERCLWLGCRLASMDRWFTYDPALRRFEIKDLVPQLERCSERAAFFRTAAAVLAKMEPSSSVTELPA